MKRAFSLIETIIYIALLSTLIGGVYMSAFYLIQSSETESASLRIGQELNFILGKIDWALTGVSQIQTPIGPPSGMTLRISKYNFSDNPLEFTLKDGRFFLSRKGGTPVPLNSQNVLVEQALFTYLSPDPTAGKPAGIEAVITINGRTATTTHYVR